MWYGIRNISYLFFLIFQITEIFVTSPFSCLLRSFELIFFPFQFFSFFYLILFHPLFLLFTSIFTSFLLLLVSFFYLTSSLTSYSLSLSFPLFPSPSIFFSLSLLFYLDLSLLILLPFSHLSFHLSLHSSLLSHLSRFHPSSISTTAIN